MKDNSSSITALIVDDSPDSLGMLNNVLNNAGITVLVALGGEQALNIISQVSPDVVLLDALMPELDGFETCRQIKRHKPELPIIFMTGLTETHDIVRGLEAGAVDYVTKPVNTQEVLARLKVHVQNARSMSSARAALDSAGQSLIEIDLLGNILWTTSHAQKLLEFYEQDPSVLSRDLSKALASWIDANNNDSKEKQNSTVALEGFSADFQSQVSASFVNTLGDNYLVKLVGEIQEAQAKTLQEKLRVTKREASVLYWLSKGKSNWDIATILSISPRTINKHLEQIYKKLEVDNRTAAATVALKALAE